MADGGRLLAFCHLSFSVCALARPLWGRLPTAEAVGYANAAAMRLSPAGVSRDVVRVCRYAAAMV